MRTISDEHASELTDVALVERSLTGDRHAFGLVVARYQSLICAMAFSATGNLARSEDLAQETFIAGWRQLNSLRDPTKLRAWLCGIARNLIHDAARSEGRNPASQADTLEQAEEVAVAEAAPVEVVMSREEERILWRSIEHIPPIYREVLVLFYREQQSIADVATALDLSEDTVKQRLSRGRKLLHAQVISFVEGALTRSAPGKAFTAGVIAALPGLTGSAQAAVAVGTAAKGSAKAAGLGGFGALLSPLLAIFGTWVGYRISLDTAESADERGYIRSFYSKLGGSILGFCVVYAGLLFWAREIISAHSMLFPALVIGLAFVYLIAIAAITVWSRRRWKQVVSRADAKSTRLRPAYEFRSRGSLLGWPLIHVRIGAGVASEYNPVKAWIAMGDCAVGLLFAFGGVAVAPFSIGGMAIGLLPFGGLAIGLLALGGTSLGMWSFGGLAVGWASFGGCALAWNAAMGGVGIAHDYALGAIAHAAQANNQMAAQFVKQHPFFSAALAVFPHLSWLNLVWVVPMLWWWRVTRRTRKALGGTLDRGFHSADAENLS